MICFVESFLVAIMNPVTITTFLIAFTAFGIRKEVGMVEMFMLLSGVLTGTLLWWMMLSGAVHLLREKVTNQLLVINKWIRVVLMIFGIVMILRS